MTLITDLDKTLIYSDKEKKFLDNDNYICVEYKNNEPLSYMTKNAYNYLKTINRKLNFIPCTMRSIDQFNRITLLKDLNPKFIICYNGCEIYIDSKLDLEYNNYINQLIDKSKVQSLYNNYKDKYPNNRVTSFKDYYFEIKANDITNKENILDTLYNDTSLVNYNIFMVSNKIYVIPKAINKQIAIDYLIQKKYIRKTYALGDSMIDKIFVHNAHFGYVPNHCEFALEKESIYKSKHSGILGGEDILAQVINTLILRKIPTIKNKLDIHINDFS